MLICYEIILMRVYLIIKVGICICINKDEKIFIFNFLYIIFKRKKNLFYIYVIMWILFYIICEFLFF